MATERTFDVLKILVVCKVDNLAVRAELIHEKLAYIDNATFFACFRPIIFTRLVCPDICIAFINTAVFKDACVQIVKNGKKPVHEGRIKN